MRDTGTRRHLQPPPTDRPGSDRHRVIHRGRCETTRPDTFIRPAAAVLAPDREWDTGPARAGGRRWRPLAVAAAFAAALVALALPWGGTGGPPHAAPGAALAGQRLVAHATYVVQPGDTLWSIATRLAPDADPRAIVQKLEPQTVNDTIFPGQRLQLP